MRQLIEKLRIEVETTVRSSIAFKQFKLALTCTECTEKINNNVHFWKIYESSVQTKVFMGIRRLYENEGDTFNFQSFINKCKREIKCFSKASLRERKLAQSDNTCDWIDDYMVDAYEPSIEDFNALSRLVKEKSKRMRRVYVPVASKIIAHAVHSDREIISQKMKDLDFDEIESALNCMWHVYSEIWNMFENGQKPILEIKNYKYKQEVSDSIDLQIGCSCNNKLGESE